MYSRSPLTNYHPVKWDGRKSQIHASQHIAQTRNIKTFKPELRAPRRCFRLQHRETLSHGRISFLIPIQTTPCTALYTVIRHKTF